MPDTASRTRVGTSRPDNTRTRHVNAAQRVTQALNRQQVFTRAQVADLIHRAYQSGFLHGVELGAEDEARRQSDLMLADIEAALAVPPFTERSLRMEGYRATARREADIAAGHPWRGDHTGGAVPVWGADLEPGPGPAVSVRWRRQGGQIVWADA